MLGSQNEKDYGRHDTDSRVRLEPHQQGDQKLSSIGRIVIPLVGREEEAQWKREENEPVMPQPFNSDSYRSQPLVRLQADHSFCRILHATNHFLSGSCRCNLNIHAALYIFLNRNQYILQLSRFRFRPSQNEQINDCFSTRDILPASTFYLKPTKRGCRRWQSYWQHQNRYG